MKREFFLHSEFDFLEETPNEEVTLDVLVESTRYNLELTAKIYYVFTNSIVADPDIVIELNEFAYNHTEYHNEIFEFFFEKFFLNQQSIAVSVAKLILLRYDRLISILKETKVLSKGEEVIVAFDELILVLSSIANEISFFCPETEYINRMKGNYTIELEVRRYGRTSKLSIGTPSRKSIELTQEQKRVVNELLGMGFRDSHIYRFLKDQKQFITVSEIDFVAFLNQEHNKNLSPNKRFTAITAMSIPKELEQHFNRIHIF